MSATTIPSLPTRGSPNNSPFSPTIIETGAGVAFNNSFILESPCESCSMASASNTHEETMLKTLPSKACAAERIRIASLRL